MKWMYIVFSTCLAFNAFAESTYSQMLDVDDKQITTTAEPIFPIGSKWWYEYKEGSQSGIATMTVVFEVVDTLMYEGRMASLIIRSDGLPDVYISEDNEEVYVYDYQVQDYVLLFDFDATISYPTRYHFKDYSGDVDVDTILLSTVYIDSIAATYDTGTSRGLAPVQKVYVDFLGNPAFEGEIMRREYDILDRVGFLEANGPTPFHWASDYGDENTVWWGSLRCFEAPDASISFLPAGSGYPCDTSYIITSTSDIDLSSEAVVYPNPFSDYLNIEITSRGEVEVTVTNLVGQIVHKSTVDEATLSIPSSTWEQGVYVVKMASLGKTIVTETVLRID